MTQGQSKPNLKRPNPYMGDNVLETVRSIGGNVNRTLQQDVVQQMPSDMIRDIFGTPASQEELKPNESIDITKNSEKVTPKDVIHALTTKDKTLMEHEIGELRKQLATLAPQTQNKEVKKAVIEQREEHVGIYHKNRLERFIENIKSAGKNPHDGLTWFQETGKRKKQRGFWGGYKKHGTSFGLSSERTAATQSG